LTTGRGSAPPADQNLVHLDQGQYSSAAVKVNPRSIAMYSVCHSPSSRRNRGSDAVGNDLASIVVHLHGQLGFDLTVHTQRAPRTSPEIGMIPLLELPGPALSDFSTTGPDKDSILDEPGGLRVVFGWSS
jgi:hypothetical protein